MTCRIISNFLHSSSYLKSRGGEHVIIFSDPLPRISVQPPFRACDSIQPSSVGVQNSTKPLDSTKAAQPKLDQEARAHVSLSRVPCSKADIFGTKLLTPLEKRRLMRFLLFASDWGLQRAGEDVLARNEAGLGRGRSLRRPQNREAASGDFDADAYADKPFREFLESCGLPERVRAMIIHALALLPGGEVKEMGEEGDQCLGEATTDEGLEAVYR